MSHHCDRSFAITQQIFRRFSPALENGKWNLKESSIHRRVTSFYPAKSEFEKCPRSRSFNSLFASATIPYVNNCIPRLFVLGLILVLLLQHKRTSNVQTILDFIHIRYPVTNIGSVIIMLRS